MSHEWGPLVSTPYAKARACRHCDVVIHFERKRNGKKPAPYYTDNTRVDGKTVKHKEPPPCTIVGSLASALRSPDDA